MRAELANWLKKPFQHGKTRWRRWRWHRLYPRRHFLAGIVSIIVLVIALFYASHLMRTHAPPVETSSAEPVIFLSPMRGRPLNGLSSFDITGNISVDGCHNPVEVELALEAYGSASIPPAQYLPVSTALDGQLADPTRSAYDFHEEVVRQAGWQDALRSTQQHVNLYSQLQTKYTGPMTTGDYFSIDRTWEERDDRFFSAPVDGLFPATSRDRGFVAFRRPVLMVNFRANWVMKRGFETCYVRVPDVATFPRGNVILRPRTASLTLHVNGGGSVDSGSSIPSPSNAQGPTWACRIQSQPYDPAASSCGAFAAVAGPDADEKLQIRLLVVGAVIALAFALLVESALKFRWPLDEAGSEE